MFGSPFRIVCAKAAGPALVAVLIAGGFVSGCSGGSLASHAGSADAATAAAGAATATAAPSASAAAEALAACSPSATLAGQTMNAGGGTLTVPACGAYSGTLAYPSFGGNTGTITATLVSSLHDTGGAGVPNGRAFLAIALVLASSNPSDTAITFASLGDGGAADCGRLAGTFASGTTYYAEGEFPFSAGVNTQTSHAEAGAGMLDTAGCSLSGESLMLGKRNEILISTSPN